jgi:hypothetical protein
MMSKPSTHLLDMALNNKEFRRLRTFSISISTKNYFSMCMIDTVKIAAVKMLVF